MGDSYRRPWWPRRVQFPMPATQTDPVNDSFSRDPLCCWAMVSPMIHYVRIRHEEVLQQLGLPPANMWTGQLGS